MSEPLINIDIDLGFDKTVNLQIDNEHEIESTLKEFCEFYNLDSQIHQTIMEQIIHKINSAGGQEESLQNNSDLQSNCDEEEQTMRVLEHQRNKENTNNDLNSKMYDIPSKPKDKLTYSDWKTVNKTQSDLNINKQHLTDTSNMNLSYVSTTLNPKKDFRGLFLYERYLGKKEEKASHTQHIKDLQKSLEMKDVTFKPKLDSKSKLIAEKIIEPGNKVEERLIKYGRDTNYKHMKEKTKRNLEDYQSSYHPDINERSIVLSSIVKKKRENIMKDRSYINRTFDNHTIDNEDHMSFDNTKSKNKLTGSNINKSTLQNKTSIETSDKNTFSNMLRDKSNDKDLSKDRDKSNNKSQISNRSHIHEYLYEEAKLKDKKREKRRKEWMDIHCSFKPYVSDASRGLITRVETTNEFIKRLMTSKKETEELLVEVRKSQTRKMQPSKSINHSKTGKIDRGINLDSYYDKKLLEKKNKIQSEEIVNNLEKKKHWLENSMKIVLKMKIQKYKDIFDLLDHDKDGYISAKNIKLSNLHTELLEALTPLLEEIQTKSLNLSFKDFCLMGDKLLKVNIFHNSSE
jgi:hypothetical protein